MKNIDKKHNPFIDEKNINKISQEDIPHISPPIHLEENGYVTCKSKEELLLFHPEVVLFQPQIPQNVGTIGRMCAGFSCRLNLIEPMPFEISEKAVRRAGLDYWEHVSLGVHKSFDDYINLRPQRRLIFIETGGKNSPYHFSFLPGDLLIFGAETHGIPPALMEKYIQEQKAHLLTIPMFQRGVRSFNLSNTVSMVMYCAIEKIHSLS